LVAKRVMPKTELKRRDGAIRFWAADNLSGGASQLHAIPLV
jgi:hypothetical protein